MTPSGTTTALTSAPRRSRTRRLRFIAVGAVAAAATIGFAPAANASPSVHDVAQGLAGPLQFSVATNGTIYVAQNFTGTLTEINAKGARHDLVQVSGGEVAGVNVNGVGDVTYTTTFASEAGATTASFLNHVVGGTASHVANTFRYENEKNPDHATHYGFVGLSNDCAKQIPPGIPLSYDGIIDSHPYSATNDGMGHTIVGEAAGNDLLQVDASGRIRTLTLFPAQPAVITADAAKANGLPPCTVGLTYRFEAVPTDVELGPDGQLYVSTLAGGPEDPSLGARSSVYKVNPSTGAAVRIATGFAGATNLAVLPNGSIYVTELFAGRVSKVVNGGPSPVLSLPDPAAIEWANGKLWVAYNAFANGTIATISL
jgi:hypothetical protein